MKIYFAGSIRGGTQDKDLYLEIIKQLQNHGEVLTEHLWTKEFKELTEKEIHDRDIDWILHSDMLIAEVTTPSLGVGYELGRALENDVPVVTLFRPSEGKKLSAMIVGAPNFQNYTYQTLQEVKLILDKVFG